MIIHPIRSLAALVIVASGVISSAGCAPLRSPYKSTGPVASREGLEIAVERQSCTQSVDREFYGQDLVEEVVDIRVRNWTSSSLTVQRDAFRLISPYGSRVKTVTFRANDPIPLDIGESKTFKLRYMTRGDLDCAQLMRLDADSGVKMLNGRRIEVGAISFQPLRAL